MSAVYNVLNISVCQDHDRRVREATQQALEQLVLKVRRSLAPFLRSLMGHWILAQCDTYTPAASAACRAFHAAFPPGKQPEALSFCRDEILNVSGDADRGGGWCLHLNLNRRNVTSSVVLSQVLQDVLLKETADTLSDPQ